MCYKNRGTPPIEHDMALASTGSYEENVSGRQMTKSSSYLLRLEVSCSPVYLDWELARFPLSSASQPCTLLRHPRSMIRFFFSFNIPWIIFVCLAISQLFIVAPAPAGL
ncbi:hypothetical protein BJX64DRAFT_195432 [Aspergillus heterothallicus]